jgi:hypothetical protein
MGGERMTAMIVRVPLIVLALALASACDSSKAGSAPTADGGSCSSLLVYPDASGVNSTLRCPVPQGSDAGCR